MLRYYIYCRKSSESEDRQVLSIESQLIELKRLAESQNLSVVDIFTESKSAKSPGRPLFDEMLKRLNARKADGIICWKLDRLARNPIDGGQISWMLQKGIIKHIQTDDRSYNPEDNVLLMNVEFGMANQYVLDLSKNVKRGLKTKAEKGWLPAMAPLGYLNDSAAEKGKREIHIDPKRFDLVRNMWELMLTGRATPSKIANIANNEWELRSLKGGPLAKSTIYQLFGNSFYTGWYEYPAGSGNWHKGSHKPMITQEEYDRVQILLGRKGKSRIKKHVFAFTGLIRCGECGVMVTAEEKNQIICSECNYKFSSNNREECPKCGIGIDKMNNPVILRYVYYHCTKKINLNCSQGSVEIKALERQIVQLLSSITISDNFKTWALEYLKEENEKEASSRELIFASQRKAYDICIKKLDNLFNLKISPSNSDGSLLSDEEYGKEKTELMKEKIRLEGVLNDTEKRVERFLKTQEKVFNYARYAQYWFAQGSPQEKADLLQTLGSNIVLSMKKLELELVTPFKVIGEIVKEVPQVSGRFEPEYNGLNKEQLDDIYLRFPSVCRGLDKVRTWIWSHLEDCSIPSFGKESGWAPRSSHLHSV